MLMKSELTETKAEVKMVGEGVAFERVRRITGYLVGTLDRFNNAKRPEERDRVKPAKAPYQRYCGRVHRRRSRTALRGLHPGLPPSLPRLPQSADP